MAINLSRSFAKPCDILCDLTVDDVAISQGTVFAGGDFMGIGFDQQKPSIKYNGQGYTCDFIIVKSPSYHTIEDIRADAEMIAICRNPKGEQVWVSTLLRTNTAASRTKTMLNGFVPYINSRAGPGGTKVVLGNSWSLTQMIPNEPAYYTYKGSSPKGLGPTSPVQWVVFRSMANIDPTDFALLTKVIGSTPSDMIPRTQEVFFNDTQHISGVADGKAYMRCRRVKKKGEGATPPRVTPVEGLEDSANKKAAKSEAEGGSTWWSWFKLTITDYVHQVGFGSILSALLFVVAMGAGVWTAYKLSTSDRGFALARTSQKAAVWTKGAASSLLDFTRKPGFFDYSGKTQAAVVAEAKS